MYSAAGRGAADSEGVMPLLASGQGIQDAARLCSSGSDHEEGHDQ